MNSGDANQFLYADEEDKARRLAQLKIKDEYAQMRIRIRRRGGKIEPFACLVCGQDIDNYTIQCDHCGYIYMPDEIVCASGAGGMRRAGVPEEQIIEVQKQIYGWVFRNNELLKRTFKHSFDHHMSPVLQAHLSRTANPAQH